MTTPPSDDIAKDLAPLLKIYKDGRVERFMGTATVPPSVDPTTGVQSTDVLISSETNLTARLYVPKQLQSSESLPLVVYFHGGGFVIESASSPTYHNYLNTLSANAAAVVLSIDYRLAPEHPLPAAYNDALSALQWVASPALSDPTLSPIRADRRRMFLAGDSAGANIAHRAALLAGLRGGFDGVELKGIVLVHPYFWGVDPIGSEVAVDPKTKAFIEKLWRAARPDTVGTDDPWINPGKESELGRLGCERVLVCVGEKDDLKDRGRYYGEVLRKSGWSGSHELDEAKGEGHVFHLFNHTSDKAVDMMAKICAFININ